MNKDYVEKMLEQLVQETLHGSRTWYPVASANVENNHALSGALEEDEWHHIRLERSYYLPFQSGYFFLFDEWIESGRGGTIFDGLVLYIQTSIENKLVEVSRDAKQLYRLTNIIAERNDFPNDVKDFIQSFLDS